jgi:hypothetical protein
MKARHFAMLGMVFVLGLGAAPVTAAVLDALDCSGCVDTKDLGAGAVTSAKIRDGAVKIADLGKKAVTRAKIKGGAVSHAKLQSGLLMAAHVNDDGTLIKGTKGVSAFHIATGWYRVTFPRDVTGCVLTANHVGETADTVYNPVTVTGRLSATQGLTSTADIFVWNTQSASYQNVDVSVLVVCP